MKGRIIPFETLEGFYDETSVQEVLSFIDNNLTGNQKNPTKVEAK